MEEVAVGILMMLLVACADVIKVLIIQENLVIVDVYV